MMQRIGSEILTILALTGVLYLGLGPVAEQGAGAAPICAPATIRDAYRPGETVAQARLYQATWRRPGGLAEHCLQTLERGLQTI